MSTFGGQIGEQKITKPVTSPSKFIYHYQPMQLSVLKLFMPFVAELYDYCMKNKIADQNLIAKWKKQGYENLCCLRCIQTRDTNFATNCICRVPKTKLEEGKIVECVHCGCRGCSG